MEKVDICAPCKKGKLCIENGCEKESTFNFDGEKKRLYCATHKKDKMINLKFLKCIHDDCYGQSLYGYLGGNVEFCAKHKTTDTVVESISGAGFPIDAGWFLQSISAISMYLDTLAVGLTATTTIFTLAITFGIVVYWMVSSWIKSEEENTLVDLDL